MFNQFSILIKNSNSRGSILLYMILISVSTLLAFLSQAGMKHTYIIENEKNYGVNIRKQQILGYIQRICFACSFFVLWFFSAFAACGADRPSYGTIFKDVTIGSVFDGWQEPAFLVFNLIFRMLGDNPRIIYVAMATVTLLFIYVTLYDLRDEIIIGYAVLAYGTLFYVQSLSLMRIYLASAILFWGIRYLKRQQYMKYLIVIFAATMIHYSSLVMLLPMAVILFMKNRRYKQYVHVSAISAALAAGFMALSICAPILGNIIIFERFQRYFENISFSSIGIMQFVYNIPICLLVFLVYYRSESNYRKLLFSFTASSFLIGLMSYIIEILGRANSLFSVLYMFIIPYCMLRVKESLYNSTGVSNGNGCRKKAAYIIISLLCICYYVFRFIIYISEYATLDDVVPYLNTVF